MDPEVQGLLEEVYTNDTEYFPSTGVGLQPQSACVITDPRQMTCSVLSEDADKRR